MIEPGSLVKCIRGAEGILDEGSIYTVWDVTDKGHLKLEELHPPLPYTCFNKDRFEDTGEFITLEAFEDYVLDPFATDVELEEQMNLVEQ